jgi:hypothetical protein
MRNGDETPFAGRHYQLVRPPRGPWTRARIDAVASILPDARALAG